MSGMNCKLERLVRALLRNVRMYAWAAYMGGLLSVLDVHYWQWQFYAAMLPMCVLVGLRPNTAISAASAEHGAVARKEGGAS